MIVVIAGTVVVFAAIALSGAVVLVERPLSVYPGASAPLKAHAGGGLRGETVGAQLAPASRSAGRGGR